MPPTRPGLKKTPEDKLPGFLKNKIKRGRKRKKERKTEKEMKESASEKEEEGNDRF